MATHDYILDNASGAAFRTDLNNALAAIVSNNSNGSSPATTYAYQWWADTSAGVLKIRNSANNAWIELLQLDGTLTLEDGSASAPALAFRDDLDTGIYSDGADTINIGTGGVERLGLSATQTVFNQGGVNTDFIIEGQSDTHLFFLDASSDRVGISANPPAAKFHVSSGSDTEVGLRISGGASGGTDIADFRTNNGTIRMKINNDVTVSTGNLVIGTSGKGVDFSSSGDGNNVSTGNEVLNEYEEGSFDMGMQVGSGSSTVHSTTSTVCRYVKCGAIVQIAGRLILSSHPGGSGDLRLTGLPFAKGNPTADGNAAGIQIHIENGKTEISNDITGLVLDGDTQILIRRSGTTAGGDDVGTRTDTGTAILFGGTYNTVA
jgi:hypothetical protein